MKSTRVIFFMLALSVIIVSLVWGQKSKKPRLPAHAIKMTAKINLKDEYRMYDSAVAILEEGVSSYPDDAEMHFLLGKAYSYKNNYPGMGEQFAIAESLDSKAKWVNELDSLKTVKWQMVFNQGAKAFNEKNLDTALVRFTACTIIDRSNYRGFLYAGYANTLKGQYDQAISFLEAGLKMNPDNLDLLKGYADALFYSEKQQEALENYNKVLEKNPKDVEVLINVISIHSNAKDYDKAFALSQKLIEADSTYKDGYFNMGTISLQKIIQINLALDSLRDASGEYLKDEKSTQRVTELTNKKKVLLTTAQASFEKVAMLDTSDVEALIYLAQVYQEEGNHDQALKILEPLSLKDSTNCSVLSQLAVIYAKEGIGDKAKVTWQKAQDCLNQQKK
jgi:tetratricopeptide (TPR) repeat protein